MAAPRTVRELIQAHEGVRLFSYDDATGKRVNPGDPCLGALTIGYGHCGPDVVPGLVCTEEVAEDWLDRDLAVAERRAAADLGLAAWAKLDVVRQAALVDMAYELGGRGLAGFAGMLDAVRAGDWLRAHDEAIDSRWAREAPSRAFTDAAILLSGDWPA